MAARTATGITQRHRPSCPGGKCKCPWRASVQLPNGGGKLRKTFATHAEAKAWRAEQQVAVKHGRAPKRPSGQPTLRQAAEDWPTGRPAERRCTR